jgi:hypothetical protein
VSSIVGRLALALCVLSGAAAADKPERVIESILPSLAYSASCSSTVELQNLADRPVAVELEPHKSTGALVPLIGYAGTTLHLNSGEKTGYKLQIEEETTSAWIKVRERISSPQLSPAIAVGGKTECVADNHLRTTIREVAYPTRNPWFAGDVQDIRSDLISLINTSEQAAKASLCYSAGGLFSVPRETGPNPELAPICSTAFAVQIPPFGSRQFPVQREGSTYFSLKTEGNAIVLQMLRPVEPSVKLYMVDSTIKFGSEVAPEGPRK